MTAPDPVLPRRPLAPAPTPGVTPAFGLGLNALFPVETRLPADLQALLVQLAAIPTR